MKSLIVPIFLFSTSVFAKTVRYELNVEQKTVNLSGKKSVDWALLVNGSIPAPTLEFTEGDDAEIVVRNGLAREEVSIHWHGILLPPEEDGVPYVNTPPIFPGMARTFRFRIRQHGTYWYHSHTALQEQKGVYGAIVIHPKKKTIQADREAVVVLSDWADENPDQILRNLKKDGDYYVYKKNSMRSIWGAYRARALKTYFGNEWLGMGGMDLSDVGYDAFLINGKKDSQLLTAKKGERIRLRIINAAASSYFHVSLAGLPMEVVSADGVDVKSVQANEVLMGMAETYDVLFTLPENKNFELRATAQDGSGFASAWIGAGVRQAATTLTPPDLYAPMDHGGSHVSHGDASSEHSEGHDHHTPTIPSLTVDNLRAPQSTQFKKKPTVDLRLVLGGDMGRYVWHINGKAIHQDRNLAIREGDVVRFTFVNETMMHHPMHLHGHFFRVLNQGEENSPLKHTVDVPPHGTRTIEFLADEPGEWMLHCHNLYHMKTGMARVVQYMSYKPSAQLQAYQKQDPHLHDHLYFSGESLLMSNLLKLQGQVSRTWDSLTLKGESQDKEFREREAELVYRRRFGKLTAALGGTWHENKGTGMVGLRTRLPFLVQTELWLIDSGRLKFELERHFQWTSRIFTDAEFKWKSVGTSEVESEYEISLLYGPSWHWAAGLMFTQQRAGVGLHLRF